MHYQGMLLEWVLKEGNHAITSHTYTAGWKLTDLRGSRQYGAWMGYDRPAELPAVLERLTVAFSDYRAWPLLKGIVTPFSELTR